MDVIVVRQSPQWCGCVGSVAKSTLATSNQTWAWVKFQDPRTTGSTDEQKFQDRRSTRSICISCHSRSRIQSMKWSGLIRCIRNPIQSRTDWIGLDQKIKKKSLILNWIIFKNFWENFNFQKYILLTCLYSSKRSAFPSMVTNMMGKCNIVLSSPTIARFSWIGLDWIHFL